MDYHSLETLRQQHPAWRLLKADHAALIVSFLHRTYIAPNIRSLPQPELASKLEDALFHLRRELGQTMFPRASQAYLDDWASDEHGWLRKYYPPEGDEPHYDITPATEKAITWLDSLARRQFVGTSSRLTTVFELLRRLIESTETDAATRITELERRRTEIDAEIMRIRGGDIPLLDAADAKERFLHAAGMARALLPLLDGRITSGGDEEVPADALFGQIYVDKGRLKARIRQALQTRAQISLSELVAAEPLEHGLAELIAYLSLAADDARAVIDDQHKQTIEWTDKDGHRRQATLPLVIFGRLQPAQLERA